MNGFCKIIYGMGGENEDFHIETLDELKECIEKCIENKAKKILYNFFKSEK